MRNTVVIDTVDKVLDADEFIGEHHNGEVTVEFRPFGFLFSYIRRFSDRPEYILPDRADITVSTPCLKSCRLHLATICNRHGATLLGDPEIVSESDIDFSNRIEEADLLQVPRGRITEGGVRGNIHVALDYLAGGRGTTATDAEFARAQLWQWVRHETGVLDSGRIISRELFSDWLKEEADKLADSHDAGKLDEAARRLREMTLAGTLGDSLEDEAYPSRD